MIAARGESVARGREARAPRALRGSLWLTDYGTDRLPASTSFPVTEVSHTPLHTRAGVCVYNTIHVRERERAKESEGEEEESYWHRA